MRPLLVLAAVLALQACAAMPSQQERAFTAQAGGYSGAQVAADRQAILQGMRDAGGSGADWSGR
ncbi:MAG TPA: hypothetical protein VME92_22070 [Acetobacteraceae bacterium]|nr:hypothetical protein [Acetobacteraceae bacterium]